MTQTSSARSSGSGKSSSSGQPEQRDPVGRRRPVGTPLGPGHALVQPVQRVVVAQLVLAPLVVGRLVGDHDRDLVEGGRERHRDRRERLVDELVERAVAAGSRAGRCEHHVGAWAWRPYPRVDGDPDARRPGPGHGLRARGVRRRGRAGRSRPLPRLGRAGRGGRARRRSWSTGSGQTAWIWAPVARRLRRRPLGRGDGPARPRALRCADRDGAYDLPVLAEDVDRGGRGLRPGRRARRNGSSSWATGSGRSSRPERRGRSARAAPVSSRRRRLGDDRGIDRHRRRRVPARPRRAAGGAALDDGLPRRPRGLRPGDLGRRPGARGARHGRRDACRAGRARDEAPRDLDRLRAGDVRLRPDRDARRRWTRRSSRSSPPTTTASARRPLARGRPSTPRERGRPVADPYACRSVTMGTT